MDLDLQKCSMYSTLYTAYVLKNLSIDVMKMIEGFLIQDENPKICEINMKTKYFKIAKNEHMYTLFYSRSDAVTFSY